MIIFFLAILFSDLFKFINPTIIPFIPFQIYFYIVYLLGIGVIYKLNFPYLKNNIFPNQKKVLYVFIFLSAIYFFSLLTSIFNDDTDFVSAIFHFFYILIPNIFLISFIKIDSINLNLVKKVNKSLIIGFFFICLIGLIQNLDNDFFYNKNYSDFTGGYEGLVRRGSIEGSFLKINSIFSSADRFSNVSFSIFLISIFNLNFLKNKNIKGDEILITYLGIISSLLGMFLAGARSPIISLILLFILAIFLFLINSRNKVSIPSYLKNLFTLTIPISLLIYVFNPSIINKIFAPLNNIGVFRLLFSGFESQLLFKRILYQAGIEGNSLFYDERLVTTDIPLFGFGLGTMGYGKPGESGIISTFAESGFFLGIIILVVFIFIAFLFSFKSITNISTSNFGYSIILLAFSLKITIAFVSGFVSLYEPCSFFILIPSLISSFTIVNTGNNKIN